MIHTGALHSVMEGSNRILKDCLPKLRLRLFMFSILNNLRKKGPLIICSTCRKRFYCRLEGERKIKKLIGENDNSKFYGFLIDITLGTSCLIFTLTTRDTLFCFPTILSLFICRAYKVRTCRTTPDRIVTTSIHFAAFSEDNKFTCTYISSIYRQNKSSS